MEGMTSKAAAAEMVIHSAMSRPISAWKRSEDTGPEEHAGHHGQAGDQHAPPSRFQAKNDAGPDIIALGKVLLDAVNVAGTKKSGAVLRYSRKTAPAQMLLLLHNVLLFQMVCLD